MDWPPERAVAHKLAHKLAQMRGWLEPERTGAVRLRGLAWQAASKVHSTLLSSRSFSISSCSPRGQTPVNCRSVMTRIAAIAACKSTQGRRRPMAAAAH